MISLRSELTREDNFIKLYKFTCSLPKDQSYMLSYLIDADDFCEIRLKDDPGFFECCVDGFIRELLTGWSRYEVDSTIEKLINAGFIYKRVIRDSVPARTFIKLNRVAIQRLNDEYKNRRTVKADDEYTVRIPKEKRQDVASDCSSTSEDNVESDYKDSTISASYDINDHCSVERDGRPRRYYTSSTELYRRR